jgi:hypothetical protein
MAAYLLALGIKRNLTYINYYLLILFEKNLVKNTGGNRHSLKKTVPQNISKAATWKNRRLCSKKHCCT